MPCVAEERAGIGEHSEEVPERREVRELAHLSCHAVDVVAEPPRGALNDLRLAVARELEAAAESRDSRRVGRVDRVENRARERVGLIHLVEELRDFSDHVEVADSVKSRVRTDSVKHPRVLVPEHAEMELHHEPARLVLAAEEGHQRSLELRHVLKRHVRAVRRERLLKDVVNLVIGRLDVIELVEPVVSGLAAHLREEIQPLQVSRAQRVKVGDLDAGSLAELLHVIRDSRLVDIQPLVRSPSRQHLNVEGIILREHFMPLESVRRVVGRAEQLHVRILNDIPHAHRRVAQLLVADLPDSVRIIAVYDQVAVEITSELKVRPMIKRVPDQLRHTPAISHKLLVIARVPGDKLLRHAAAAHSTPLIMIPAEPHLSDVRINLILSNLARGNMAVIVNYRQIRGVSMIKRARRLGLEKEILSHERFHF